MVVKKLEKVRTTIYIDDRIMQLVRLEDLNLSNLINEYLSRYLETNGMEALDKKINSTEEQLKALKDRKKDLLRSGQLESREDQMRTKIMAELQEMYLKRRQDNLPLDQEEKWISGPRNLKKCSLLAMSPVEVLIELKHWYKNQKKPGK